MAAFTEKEPNYLRSQRLARMATADSGGQPHVVPVGFRVSADAAAIEVGGRNFGNTKKYRDIRVNPRVAIVIDDLASVTPWTPRGIEVRGRRCCRLEEEALCRQMSLGRGSRPSGS